MFFLARFVTIRNFRISVLGVIAMTAWIDCGSLAQGQANPEIDSSRFLKEMEQLVRKTAEDGCRSVVAISRVPKGNEARQQALQFQLGFPLGVPKIASPQDPDYLPVGFGSGLVWDADGTIVTAYHVLDDPRTHDYFVWYMDRPMLAKVVAVPAIVQAGDPYSDLAVLKVGAMGLPPIKRDSSLRPTKGDFVIAIGNPYAIARDGEASVRWGLISNVRRPQSADTRPNQEQGLDKGSLHYYGTLLETDSRLELGSSGGGLFNLDGKCIGMTMAYAALEGYEREGGFALPIDETFERIVQSLREGRQPTFGFLGIQPDNLPASDRSRGLLGARVSAVIRGMPGDQAGLREGDIITEVGGEMIEHRDALFRELSRQHPESVITLTVLRRNFNADRLESLKLTAKLSKKYVALSRPAYSLHPEPLWRGMKVEYATALPAEMLRYSNRGFLNISNSSLAVLDVEPNSPSWNAGIRPGFSIVEVDGRSFSSPDSFHEYVHSRPVQSIRMKIIGYGDRSRDVNIAPPPAPEPAIE